MLSGTQVRNGKAFEYALAMAYYSYLLEKEIDVVIVNDNAFKTAKEYYYQLEFVERKRFDYCCALTIDSIVKIEPGLTAVKQSKPLQIVINSDFAGEQGDVRDVIFRRSNWEIGFSAKNNNDAVKHSRLSSILDFGESWFNVRCSDEYWNEISPIFDYLGEMKKASKSWKDLGDEKITKVYLPLLHAFKNEVLRINNSNEGIPQKLIRYLIGNYSFYKIIKDDISNMVIIKAFNIEGELNRPFDGVKSHYKIPVINLPTRIVEFEMMEGSSNTLNMILNKGWEVSFRIHNASSKVEQSLKFDIQLLGNPPILFSHHIFIQDEIN